MSDAMFSHTDRAVSLKPQPGFVGTPGIDGFCVGAARSERAPYRILRAAMLAGIFALVASSPLRAAPLAVGQAFPRFSDFVLEGTVPDTTQAKVVVVDFWASWCAPCRAAFPVLDQVQAEFGPKGVQVIAVSVDRNRAAMEAFLKRSPVGFAVVRDASMKLVGGIEVPTMPTTFVLDAKGVVRFVHSGFRADETPARLREEITTLLEETT